MDSSAGTRRTPPHLPTPRSRSCHEVDMKAIPRPTFEYCSIVEQTLIAKIQSGSFTKPNAHEHIAARLCTLFCSEIVRAPQGPLGGFHASGVGWHVGTCGVLAPEGCCGVLPLSCPEHPKLPSSQTRVWARVSELAVASYPLGPGGRELMKNVF